MGYYVDSQNITLLYSEWLGRMNITILLVWKNFFLCFYHGCRPPVIYFKQKFWTQTEKHSSVKVKSRFCWFLIETHLSVCKRSLSANQRPVSWSHHSQPIRGQYRMVTWSLSANQRPSLCMRGQMILVSKISGDCFNCNIPSHAQSFVL